MTRIREVEQMTVEPDRTSMYATSVVPATPAAYRSSMLKVAVLFEVLDELTL